MKIHSLFVLLFCGYNLCSGQQISHVYLIGRTSYAIDVLNRAVNIVEERVRWSNFKLPDYTFQLNDNVLSKPFRGTLVYTEGFLTSIQRIDIGNTVNQIWRLNPVTRTSTVSVEATLNLYDVAVGFDVTGHISGNNEVYRYTALFVHPSVSYRFSITKDLFTDALSVTVVGTVPVVGPNSPLAAEFRPEDDISDIFRQTFDANAATAPGIAAWGPEIFQNITLEVVTRDVEFPSICYNCPVPLT